MISLSLVLAAARFGWLGPDVGRGDGFCEAVRPGWIRQPANTWSNLAFVIAGLAVAWYAADRVRLGLTLGALGAMLIFARRVQANVYKQAEGSPGAAAWSLQNNLRGKWRISPAIAGTAQFDAVHRVVGRPGVVLIAEGAPQRVIPLLAQEKKREAAG